MAQQTFQPQMLRTEGYFAAEGVCEHVLEATGSEELSVVIGSLAEAAVLIAHVIRETPVETLSTRNPTGDVQSNLDLAADRIIEDALRRTRLVGELASEESDTVRTLQPTGRALYSAVVDPLDGSGNVRLGWPAGFLAGVLPGAGLLKKGQFIEASAAAMFGNRTLFVYAARHCGTHVFEIDRNGRFHLRSEWIRVPPRGTVAMFGGRLGAPWLRDAVPATLDLHKSRYSGCLVADLMHFLLDDSGSLWVHPEAKLRFLFEILPASLLIHEAGGFAVAVVDGHSCYADQIVSRGLREQYPFVFGSPHAVRQFLMSNPFGKSRNGSAIATNSHSSGVERKPQNTECHTGRTRGWYQVIDIIRRLYAERDSDQVVGCSRLEHGRAQYRAVERTGEMIVTADFFPNGMVKFVEEEPGAVQAHPPTDIGPEEIGFAYRLLLDGAHGDSLPVFRRDAHQRKSGWVEAAE